MPNCARNRGTTRLIAAPSKYLRRTNSKNRPAPRGAQSGNTLIPMFPTVVPQATRTVPVFVRL